MHLKPGIEISSSASFHKNVLRNLEELQQRVRELEAQLKNPQEGQAHKAPLKNPLLAHFHTGKPLVHVCHGRMPSCHLYTGAVYDARQHWRTKNTTKPLQRPQRIWTRAMALCAVVGRANVVSRIQKKGVIQVLPPRPEQSKKSFS